ncbi:MAG: hypothetical protein NTY36_00870 [Deltaproteobacteria bacterium]|nr:hypothetical protein [Deltaproteobacteria bacterium]
MADEDALRLLWDRRLIDAAVITAASAAPGYPLACLKDPLPCRTYRSAGLAAQSLVIDLGEPAYCTCLGLVNHNFTNDGQITVQAAATPDFAAPLYTEEFPVWRPIIGFGEGGAGEHGAGGMILESERSFYAPSPLGLYYFATVDGDYVKARYWRLDLADAANPAGYFEIGRLFLGLFDEFIWQFDWQNRSLLPKDDSDNRYSTGGQRWPICKPTRRGQRLPWSLLAPADKNWRLLFFLGKVGITVPFIIDPLPAGLPSERYFSAMYGHLTELPEVKNVANQYSSAELVVEEDL